MKTGPKTMQSQPPTPETAEHVIFLIRWWQEILGGIIITLTTLFLKSKGKEADNTIIPMSQIEIQQQLTICKQGIILELHKMLEERGMRIEAKLEVRDRHLLEEIEKLHMRINREIIKS